MVCKGHIWFSILTASVVWLRFSMQEDDVLEHTNVKCHSCTLSQHVGHCVTHAYASWHCWSYSCQDISECIWMPSVMRWHQWCSCNLAWASKWGKSQYFARDTKYPRQCSAKKKPSWRRLLYLYMYRQQHLISQTSKYICDDRPLIVESFFPVLVHATTQTCKYYCDDWLT